VVSTIISGDDDGFRLHRLIDPETTPAESFCGIGDLQRPSELDRA